jgi:hypothetical protein
LQAAHAPVELLGDLLQVLVDERLDVTLVARLRPAALVVPARLLVELIDELVEPASPKHVHRAALSPHHRHERTVASTDERHERRQIELTSDRDLVGNRIRERRRPPDVVEAGREDGDATGAVTVELGREKLPDPHQVGAQSLALLVRQLMRRLRTLASLVDE